MRPVLRRRIGPAVPACQPQAIDQLVLSSTGPADGRAWLPVEYLAIGLVRLLPEQRVKRLLAGQLGKVLTTDPKDREDWRAGRPRYERLFERHVETISRGQAGRAFALFDPPQYVHWLQQALA